MLQQYRVTGKLIEKANLGTESSSFLCSAAEDVTRCPAETEVPAERVTLRIKQVEN